MVLAGVAHGLGKAWEEVNGVDYSDQITELDAIQTRMDLREGYELCASQRAGCAFVTIDDVEWAPVYDNPGGVTKLPYPKSEITFKYADPKYPSHRGIDYPKKIGTPVPSTTGGKALIGVSERYGVYVRVIHAEGESLYAHLSEVTIQHGAQVSVGQIIGKTGNTGWDFVSNVRVGRHLHYGVRINGILLNPAP